MKYVFYNLMRLGDQLVVYEILRNIVNNNPQHEFYFFNRRFNEKHCMYSDIENFSYSNKFKNKYLNFCIDLLNNKKNPLYTIKDDCILINTWNVPEFHVVLCKNWNIYEYHKAWKTKICDKLNLKFPLNEESKINKQLIPKMQFYDISKFDIIYEKHKDKKKVFYFNNHGCSGQMLNYNHVPVIDYISKKFPDIIFFICEKENYKFNSNVYNCQDLGFNSTWRNKDDESGHCLYQMALISSKCDISFYKQTGRNFFIGNDYELDKIKNGNDNIKVFIGPDKRHKGYIEFGPWAIYFNNMSQQYCNRNFFKYNITVDWKEKEAQISEKIGNVIDKALLQLNT